MKQRVFGKNAQGETATLYTFENSSGMVMEVTDFGATLVSLLVPDGKGSRLDVVLGHDAPQGYEGPDCTFIGATVGRNANRIAKGRFVLNGKHYQLDANDGPNNLHSGNDFQSFRVWKVKGYTENSITFSLRSPHMDQGFPGALDIQVTYTLTEDNALRLDYYGIPEEDTIINYTNHTYFNLNGHASGPITGHTLRMDADAFTPADQESIPTGEIRPVEGSPMDFRVKKEVGRDIDADYDATRYGGGYDHNWCLNNAGRFAKVAELTADKSGLTMEVWTDLPGMQVYTGNFLRGEVGKNGVPYPKRQGICFETQYYPDAPNHGSFPSTVCRAGNVYRTATAYRFR